jgi:two-component system OmpR family response regulator
MMPPPKEVFARILVIEDEPDLQEALVGYLNMEGMAAHGVSNLHEAQLWIASHDFDILLLDLGLPDGDGIPWLKKHSDLRDKGVIITTARSDGLSRVSGIRAGADVYLVKPLLPEEIVSLVHNLMRRLRGNAPLTWLLDSTGWRLMAPDGRSLKLTHSEHALLQRLSQSCGQAVSREELASCLGHNPEHYDFRRLEILVRRLRNKTKEMLDIPLPLETAHRQGYAFTANIQAGKQRGLFR